MILGRLILGAIKSNVGIVCMIARMLMCGEISSPALASRYGSSFAGDSF
jgi:hypothetical protein